MRCSVRDVTQERNGTLSTNRGDNDMSATAPKDNEPIVPALDDYDALATLYNALMTGLALSLIAHHGERVARDFVQAHFRRQHHEKFLPGLRKLGLDRQPHAVACALYHYHSNALGGVRTEYFRESDRKAWVRYPPPRWIWRGTAACAIPHSVNIAMLHGWHAHNGVSLNNPRLGFVCTGTLTSGQAGLEGYYQEYDEILTPEARLRFVDNEQMPRVAQASQPVLDVDSWPVERRRKTHRSYAMEYVRSLVPTLIGLLGVDAALAEIGRTARLIGLQFYDEIATSMGGASPASDANTRISFAMLLARLLTAQGEQVDLMQQADGTAIITMQGWRLMQGVALEQSNRAPAFHAWSQLMVGMSMACDRFMRVDVALSGAEESVWRVT